MRCSLRSASGGFAEYVSISEDLLVIKPSSLTFAQAAAVSMAGMAGWSQAASRGAGAGGWPAMPWT